VVDISLVLCPGGGIGVAVIVVVGIAVAVVIGVTFVIASGIAVGVTMQWCCLA
jgi:hypothetical protein